MPWKLLDWLLGKGHSALLRHSEIKTFVDLHSNEWSFGFKDEDRKDAMTPLSNVFSLDIDAKLNKLVCFKSWDPGAVTCFLY
ncbi:hypothetical protein RDABS01_026483 [Bienertia sinuspersici]